MCFYQRYDITNMISLICEAYFMVQFIDWLLDFTSYDDHQHFNVAFNLIILIIFSLRKSIITMITVIIKSHKHWKPPSKSP